MTPLDRARRYAAIFLNAGDDWPDYRPVDAALRLDGTVYLGGVRMRRVDDAWELTTNRQTVTVRRKTAELADTEATPDTRLPAEG
jgi:hypothetical protein